LVSFNGYKYFVIFIDDFSRTTWLYLLKNKSEVFSQFVDFCNYVENQFDTKIKIFRSDNGTEFVNQNFANLFKEKGILHQTTCVYTPQQNGVSERKNRHLLEVTRVLLFQNNVPKDFWSDAVLTATYLINRLPSAKLDYKSPLEILYQEKININHLKVFGCICFVHKNKQDKFDYTSIKAIFLGYSSQKKGYKCYDPIQNKFYISRHVTFQEDEPYFKLEKEIKNQEILNVFSFPYYSSQTLEETLDENENEISQEEGVSEENENRDVVNSVRRSTRISQQPTRLRDFVTYKIMHPIEFFLSCYKRIYGLLDFNWKRK
jgi:transposase InsO family protein